MILLDTSGLLSSPSADQKHHQVCLEILPHESGPLLLSPFVLAELDYLIGKLLGDQAALQLLEEVDQGGYELIPFTRADLSVAMDVIRTYHDLPVGITDASIVALSQRYRCNRVLTLDQRHFRILKAGYGQPFQILPADE